MMVSGFIVEGSSDIHSRGGSDAIVERLVTS